MMSTFLRGLVSLSIVSAALGLVVPRADVLLPSDDPFYAQPANISSYQPGEIIAWRTVDANLNGLLGESITEISLNATYQYLYRTVDSFQNPVAAVTTVMVPFNADPSKLLSYQTAYDSANNDCSPSYLLQAGADNVAVVDIIMVCSSPRYIHRLATINDQTNLYPLPAARSSPRQRLLHRLLRL